MDKSINGNQKRRGRPRSGVRSHIAARVTDEETQLIDACAKRNGITRAEAIRRLLQKALKAEEEPHSP
ncbi:ribbon-helix-helix protein, CopG family [Saccharibacter floricola]|uniref:ribbon-helix-helix protein, CopG family n=1 Tax=Saccharibacter floricola TaxID=231053 RepID=UPI0012E9A431